MLRRFSFRLATQPMVNAYQEARDLIVARVYQRRLLIKLRRLCEFPLLVAGASVEVVGFIKLRIEPDRRFEFFLSFLEILFQRDSQPASCMRLCQLWIKLQSLATSGLRLV